FICEMSSGFVPSVASPSPSKATSASNLSSDAYKGWACEATNSCGSGLGPAVIATIVIMSVIAFMAIFGMILWVRMRTKRDTDVGQAQKQRRDRYLNKRRRRGSRKESGIANLSLSRMPKKNSMKKSTSINSGGPSGENAAAPMLLAGARMTSEPEHTQSQQHVQNFQQFNAPPPLANEILGTPPLRLAYDQNVQMSPNIHYHPEYNLADQMNSSQTQYYQQPPQNFVPQATMTGFQQQYQPEFQQHYNNSPQLQYQQIPQSQFQSTPNFYGQTNNNRIIPLRFLMILIMGLVQHFLDSIETKRKQNFGVTKNAGRPFINSAHVSGFDNANLVNQTFVSKFRKTFCGLPKLSQEKLEKLNCTREFKPKVTGFRQLTYNNENQVVESLYNWKPDVQAEMDTPKFFLAPKCNKKTTTVSYVATNSVSAYRRNPKVIPRQNSCANTVGGTSFKVSDKYGPVKGVTPGSYVGKVTFTGGFCSATLIGPNHIITAAHCVYENGQWSDNLKFAPGFNDGVAPFGQFSWKSIIVFDDWVQGYGSGNGGSLDYDMAIVELDGGVGSFMNFAYTSTWGGQGLSVWGYPYTHENEMEAETNNPTCSGHSGSSAWYDSKNVYGVVSFSSGSSVYMNYMTQRCSTYTASSSQPFDSLVASTTTTKTTTTTVKASTKASTTATLFSKTNISSKASSTLISPTPIVTNDWAFCTVNSECSSKCCSKEYSNDGKLKCTPGGSQCVSTSNLLLTTSSIKTTTKTMTTAAKTTTTTAANTTTTTAPKTTTTTAAKTTTTTAAKTTTTTAAKTTTTKSVASSSLLVEWALCTISSQCSNKCCSKQYSNDGKYKCTAGGSVCI
ncbi:hypothetical protein HK096_003136, partial [Nowakowskiella sp. JEL0078]